MTQNFGNQSEQVIIEYLKQQNFTVLAHNYKKFFGEIDIIAQKKDLIIFVEVKARKNSKLSLHHLITYPKQQKIIRTAKSFIAEQACPMQEITFRFDVALLHLQDNQEPQLTYIPNAFSASTIW